MKRILLTFIVVGIAFSCQEENPSLKGGDNQIQDLNDMNFHTTGTPPVVGRFSPRYGVPGTEVTILGSGFGATTADNRVGFTQSVSGHVTTWVEAVVLEGSPDRIRAIVPEGAITGRIIVVARFEEFIGYSYGSDTSPSDFEVLNDIPRTGLIGFWPFSGNGIEKGLNNAALDFNLSVSEAPTLSTDRFGKVMQALTFDGQQRAAQTTTQVVPQQPWTISFWLKYPSPSGDMGLFDTRQPNTIEPFLYCQLVRGINAQGIYTRGDGGSGPGMDYTLSPSQLYPIAPANNWVNITLTYTGRVYKLYQDGVEIESNIVMASTTPSNAFIIGSTANNFYIGQMDDVAVYDRALDSGDVIKLFEQTLSRY